MTGLHSPWPLFGNNLDLARNWLRPQLQGFLSSRTGHLAISLGMSDALLDAVGNGSIQAEANALREWRFRVARLHGETNPYRHLLPERLFERTLEAIAQNTTTGIPLGVQLNGGIGDHLEALSLLLPWAKAQNYRLNLEMSSERQRQIEPLILRLPQICCNKSHEQNAAPIPVMALRAVAVDNVELRHYRPWLLQKQTKQQSERHWLFCWRAMGDGDKFSAHSRSVPWELAYGFYRHLKRLQPRSCIVDITNWRDWEASKLICMGVQVLDPRQGTLLGLAERCRVSRVVTIDTSLVHLCAAAGLRADLLLNAFPDERWQELHRPEHNYGQLIRLWRSSQFGSWSDVLTSLATSLASPSEG